MSATFLASVCAALEAGAARGEVAGPAALDRVSSELERAAVALRTHSTASGPRTDAKTADGGLPIFPG